DVLQLTVSPGLEQLTTLDLSDNWISIKGVEMVLQSSLLPRLRTLVLSGNSKIARQPLEKLARAEKDPAKAAMLREAAEQLHPFKQQKYIGRRMQRVKLLRWQGGGNCEGLIKALGDSRKDVRAAAAEELGGMGKSALRALPALV